MVSFLNGVVQMKIFVTTHSRFGINICPIDGQNWDRRFFILVCVHTRVCAHVCL